MVWLLSTTVTLCHPPSSMRNNLISFAFEDVEDICTQVSVNLFLTLVLWWFVNFRWFLSTTVTLCHPPPPRLGIISKLVWKSQGQQAAVWRDSWTLLPVWLAITGSLLISFAFEDVEDIGTQVSVNLFFPLVLWWSINFRFCCNLWLYVGRYSR